MKLTYKLIKLRRDILLNITLYKNCYNCFQKPGEPNELFKFNMTSCKLNEATFQNFNSRIM